MTDELDGATIVRREARLLEVARRNYPTIPGGWVPVLLVTEGGNDLWLATTAGRPLPVPARCCEVRMADVTQEEG